MHGKAMKKLPKSKFKKFVFSQAASLGGLKKVAMILPLSRLKFFLHMLEPKDFCKRSCKAFDEEHEWKKSAAPIVQSYLAEVQMNNLL
jgi:hypothetical protein